MISLSFPNSRKAGRGIETTIQVQSRQKPQLNSTNVFQHPMTWDSPYFQPVTHNKMKAQSMSLLLFFPLHPSSRKTLVPDLEDWEPGNLHSHIPCSLGHGEEMGVEFTGSTRTPNLLSGLVMGDAWRRLPWFPQGGSKEAKDRTAQTDFVWNML